MKRHRWMLKILVLALGAVGLPAAVSGLLLPDSVKAGELIAKWHCEQSAHGDRFLMMPESSTLAVEFACMENTVNRLRQVAMPHCGDVALLIEYRARYSLDGAVVRVKYFGVPSCEVFSRAGRERLRNYELGWDDLLLLRRSEGWMVGRRIGGVVY